MSTKELRVGAKPCTCAAHDTAAPVPSNVTFNARIAERRQNHDVRAFISQGVPEPPADNAAELRAAAVETLRNCVAPPTNESFNARVRAQRS